GCFWCLEAIYVRLQGVLAVHSGYAGGNTANPSYEEVSAWTTGHVEVIEVTFDAEVITCEQILEIFFAFHDPMTRDRQGNDVGTQYRSAIFFTTPEQKTTAEKVIANLEEQHIFAQPIVTEVRPLEMFYPAESYHERYFDRNPDQAYCQAIISPKISKLRAKYSGLLK
ncbi:MAG: peptide-methionine (S)-S-oxide reductase MsrA, partial [Candidatus Moraniibacteriota bacterium]